MKYLVISCLDRETTLEAMCDTYEEAYEVLKETFIDYQRECGYSEENISLIEAQFDDVGDFEFPDCGIVVDGYIRAWSDSGREPYDIRIVTQ